MIDSLELDDILGVLGSWSSANAILLADGMSQESEDAIIDLLEFSFHFRDVFLRVRRRLLDVLLSLCAICSSLSATSAAD